jgi:hypothetical protein
MGGLTVIGLRDRFDALRPPPSGLEIESPDGETFKLDDLDPGLRRGANFVRRRVGFHFKSGYGNWRSHVFTSVYPK